MTTDTNQMNTQTAVRSETPEVFPHAEAAFGVETLSPCPICGQGARVVTFAGGRAGVECADLVCGCRQRLHDTREEAIAAWNTRATATLERQRNALAAEVEELKADNLHTTAERDHAREQWGKAEAEVEELRELVTSLRGKLKQAITNY